MRPGSAARRGSSAAWLLALSVVAAAQGSPPELGAEGLLSNDVFLPLAKDAAKALVEGDAALAAARAAEQGGQGERERSAAFDAWLRALASGPETLVPGGDPAEETPRFARGIEDAVLARIQSLTPAERAAWGARVGPLAEAGFALSAASASLGELERRHPATTVAARASLALADRALERGRPVEARGWLARAERHARLALLEEPWPAALERRRAALDGASRSSRPAEAWRTARSLSALGTLALEGARDADAPTARGPHGGVRPGLVALEDGRIAVQTARRVLLLRAGAGGALVPAGLPFEPAELLVDVLGPPSPTVASPLPPGWCLAPAASGRRLVFVQGRAVGEDAVPNALVCFELPTDADSGPLELLSPQRLPRLVWAISGDRWIRGRAVPGTSGGAAPADDDAPWTEPALEELAEAELQPAPQIVGGLVLVQARVYASPIEAWCLAFELETGALAWKQRLALGSDVTPDGGRLGSGPRLAAQPLVAAGGQVFAGTHLGAGVLLDAWDGRLRWALANRRRDPADPSWGGAAPQAFAVPEGALELAWAPADSDRLYRLTLDPPPSPQLSTSALLRAPPVAPEDALALVGADERGLVVLSSAGREHCVSLRSWIPGERRIDSLVLGPGEGFPGTGLASATRVYACSDRGLYLFDRERELYLLDEEPLAARGGDDARSEEGPGGGAGGDVAAAGELVFVLGRDTLWIFRAE